MRIGISFMRVYAGTATLAPQSSVGAEGLTKHSAGRPRREAEGPNGDAGGRESAGGGSTVHRQRWYSTRTAHVGVRVKDSHSL